MRVNGLRLSERLASRPQPNVTLTPTHYSCLQNLNIQGVRGWQKLKTGLSHDSVNRFLLRERYEPKDLFDEVKQQINVVGGTLSGDDTVIDKPHSDPKITAIFWLLLFWKASEVQLREFS